MSGRFNNLDESQKNILKQFYREYYTFFDKLPLQQPAFTEEKQGKNSSSGFASLKNKLKINKKDDDSKKEVDPLSLTQEQFRKSYHEQNQYDHPDSVTLRYIRARKWDVEKSLGMFTTAVTFFHNVDLANLKKVGDTQVNMNLSKKNQVYMQGVDKDGRPVCHVISKLHDPKALNMDQLEHYCLLIMESARLLLVNPADTVSIVFDLTDMTMANMDNASIRFLINCLEKYYPECLGRIIALNAPWFFSGIWKLISPLLDPVVAAKVKFASTSELKEYIDPSQLRLDKEGTGELDYEYIEPTAEENAKLLDDAGRQEAAALHNKAWEHFEIINRQWIVAEGEAEVKLNVEREAAAKEISATYERLDPFIRARTIYHRIGVLKGFNNVDWNTLKKN